MLDKYQMEYKYNGEDSLLEFFLFVNPLNKESMHCVHEIQELTKQINMDIYSHTLPFNSFNIHNSLFLQKTGELMSLAERNFLYRRSYQACLAYKAACMQGKQRGLDFLFAFHQAFKDRDFSFTDDELTHLIAPLPLDAMTFIDDYRSDFVRQMYQKDQRVAKSMGVTSEPSLVIYDHNFRECATIITGEITQEIIIKELDKMMRAYHEKKQRLHRHEKVVPFKFKIISSASS